MPTTSLQRSKPRTTLDESTTLMSAHDTRYYDVHSVTQLSLHALQRKRSTPQAAQAQTRREGRLRLHPTCDVHAHVRTCGSDAAGRPQLQLRVRRRTTALAGTVRLCRLPGGTATVQRPGGSKVRCAAVHLPGSLSAETYILKEYRKSSVAAMGQRCAPHCPRATPSPSPGNRLSRTRVAWRGLDERGQPSRLARTGTPFEKHAAAQVLHARPPLCAHLVLPTWRYPRMSHWRQ